jgi:hypothetical protein
MSHEWDKPVVKVKNKTWIILRPYTEMRLLIVTERPDVKNGGYMQGRRLAAPPQVTINSCPRPRLRKGREC